jgi:hypothetical protein
VQVREGGEARSIYKWVNSGGSFGANPLVQTIGLGKADRIESPEVYRPASDLTQTLTEVPIERRLPLEEGGDRVALP